MTKRNRFTHVLLSLMVALVLVLSACTPAATPTAAPAEPTQAPAATQPPAAQPTEAAPTEAPKEPVKLGVVLTLTTNFAVYGTPMMNGVKLAVEHANANGGVNGHPIEIIVEDAADTPTTGINALNKVLESNPIALVGPILGFMMIPFREVVDKEQIPIISLSGTRGYTMNNNKYVFRTAEFDGNSKPALTRFVVENLGAKRVGILVVNNEWGLSGRDHVTATLRQKYNMEPVAVETYQTTDVDMSAQLLNLQKANVDVIVSQGHPADTAIIMKQYKQLGIEAPLVACSVAQTSINLDITEPEDVEGVYVQTYALPWDDPDPAIKAWAEEYYQKFNSIPDAYALAQYDGVMMLVEAMKRAEENGNLTRQGIADEMWKIEYKGLVTTYKADSEGNMMRDYIIVKYGADKKGEIVARYSVPEEETIYQIEK